jgi:hypothetical protein
MFTGLKAAEPTVCMLARRRILLSGCFNTMQGTLLRRRQIGLGHSLREKRSRREQRLAGLNANSKSLGANGNGGFAVTQCALRQLEGATRRRAEGYGRFHYLDNAKFCSNARGSCWEVLDHLIAAADEKLLSDELLDRGRKLVGDAVRLLNGYMNYLKRVQNAIPAQNTVTGDTREPITDHK